MQNGNVWEKAGVAVSVVYGTMPASAYRAAVGKTDVPIQEVGVGHARGACFCRRVCQFLLRLVQGRALLW